MRSLTTVLLVLILHVSAVVSFSYVRPALTNVAQFQGMIAVHKAELIQSNTLLFSHEFGYRLPQSTGISDSLVSFSNKVSQLRTPNHHTNCHALDSSPSHRTAVMWRTTLTKYQNLDYNKCRLFVNGPAISNVFFLHLNSNIVLFLRAIFLFRFEYDEIYPEISSRDVRDAIEQCPGHF